MPTPNCLICLKPGAATEGVDRQDATWQRCDHCGGEFEVSGPADALLGMLKDDVGAEKAYEIRSVLSEVVKRSRGTTTPKISAMAVEAARDAAMSRE